MRSKYTIKESERIEALVECALSAQTKADAKKYIDQLDCIAFDVTGYSRGVLSEVKSMTLAAAGRVRDKERLVESAQWYLNKFLMHCVE